MLGPGPRLIKKIIYRAAVSHRLRNTGVVDTLTGVLPVLNVFSVQHVGKDAYTQ